MGARARDAIRLMYESMAGAFRPGLLEPGPEASCQEVAEFKQIYDIDGFIEADDRDYQPVRDAMQIMNLNPPK